MIEGLLSLEKAALERLTESRIASGSLGEEVEEFLSSAGVYWDEIILKARRSRTVHWSWAPPARWSRR